MNFDSFGMVPWGALGRRWDVRRWLPVLCDFLEDYAIVNGLDRIMMMNTESPRLAVTPGEWYASNMLATMSTDLLQMMEIPDVIGAMKDCRTVWGFPQIDSATVDCGTVELDDLIFRRMSFPPGEIVTIYGGLF